MPSIPVSYLFDSSKQMLGEYEIARRNRVANMQKQVRALLNEMVDELSEANAARWMLEHRDELCRKIVSIEALQEEFDFKEKAG